MDSTGIAAVRPTGETLVTKSVGDPFQLFDQGRTQEILRGTNNVLMGHGRAATVGKVTRRNAHPFEFETLIGCHNGTLTNRHNMKYGNRYDTDSEALLAQIEDDGVEKTFEKLQGAWAITWYDKEKKQLNFLRNKERPLFLGFTSDKLTLLWASEKWMLQVAANRNKLEVKAENIEELPINTLHTITLPEPTKPFAEPGKQEIKEYVPFTQPLVVTGGYQGPKDTTRGVTTDSEKKNPNASSILVGANPALLPGCSVDVRVIGICNDHGSKYLKLESLRDKVVSTTEDIRCYFDDKEAQMASSYINKLINIQITRFSYRGNKFIYKTALDEFIPFTRHPTNLIEFRKETYHGVMMTKKEFDQTYDSGCAFCTQPVHFSDTGWKALSKDAILCPDCSDNPDIRNMHLS